MIYPTKAVKAIIVNNNKILIVKNKKNKWDLPGGLIEDEETKKEALEREVFEETSLNINIKKKASSWEFIRSYDDKRITVENYLCEISEGNNDFNLSNEHSDFKWITPVEIAKFNVKDTSLIKSIISIFKDN